MTAEKTKYICDPKKNTECKKQVAGYTVGFAIAQQSQNAQPSTKTGSQ